MQNKICQECGRSMVEMLGVLAIIGVLSVGGIAGYSKAMEKYKINKTIDQISRVVTAMQTVFVNEKKYSDSLGEAYISGDDEAVEKMLTLGIISKDMIASSTISGNDGIGTRIVNLFQGGIWIHPDDVGDSQKAFVLSYGGLTKNVCIALATQDWNTLGVHNIGMNGNDGDLLGWSQDCDEPDDGFGGSMLIACPGGKNIPIPIPLSIAEQVCSDCDKYDYGCNIVWGFRN